MLAVSGEGYGPTTLKVKPAAVSTKLKRNENNGEPEGALRRIWDEQVGSTAHCCCGGLVHYTYGGCRRFCPIIVTLIIVIVAPLDIP